MITNGYVKFNVFFKDGVVTVSKSDTSSVHKLRIPADLAVKVAEKILELTEANKLEKESSIKPIYMKPPISEEEEEQIEDNEEVEE